MKILDFIPLYIIFSPFIYLYFSTCSYVAKMETDYGYLNKWVFRIYLVSSAMTLAIYFKNKPMLTIQSPCIKEPIKSGMIK